MDYTEKRFSWTLPTDINLYYCGERVNTENHSYGPQIRDHYLLVYIVKGKAVLSLHNKQYTLSKGQIFCMFPYEKIYYKAIKDSLWSILWVGIYGNQASIYLNNLNITKNNPVFSVPFPNETEKAMRNIISLADDTTAKGKIKTISSLYNFFSSLYAENETETATAYIAPANSYDLHEINYASDNIYIREAQNYIRFHYEREISIGGLAKELHLSPEYFCRLFKRETKMTPNEMISKYRIEKAKSLLCTTNLTVSQIALCTGFKTSNYFCRIFKAHTGTTPAVYRKKQG